MNQELKSSQPAASFLAALGLSAGFMAFVAWDQSHWWSRKEDYSFGWLVPLFTAYVVYDRWPQILARLRAAETGPASARWVRWTLNTLAGLGLLCGALFFLLGAFYRAGAGTSQPGTFALTLGMVAIVLPLIFFNVPTAGAEMGTAQEQAKGLRALWADGRFRVAALFIFPVLVWLISAPLVSAIESQISLFLLRKVVTVVAFVFDVGTGVVWFDPRVLKLNKEDASGLEADEALREDDVEGPKSIAEYEAWKLERGEATANS
ncbi:MAG TPA: archaeosortase/exosortase family protein, partial [Lacunisphaera sp.]|nr:archaeosortase/exosortase family protein [Lacunisphaera sp.]